MEYVYVTSVIAPTLTMSTGQFDLISSAPKAESREAIHLSLLLIVDWLAVWAAACSSAHCATFCDSLRLELPALELAKKLQHKNNP